MEKDRPGNFGLLLASQLASQLSTALGDRSDDFFVTCAPPVEFCEVDPMQTESLACTIVELQPSRPMHMRAADGM